MCSLVVHLFLPWDLHFVGLTINLWVMDSSSFVVCAEARLMLSSKLPGLGLVLGCPSLPPTCKQALDQAYHHPSGHSAAPPFLISFPTGSPSPGMSISSLCLLFLVINQTCWVESKETKRRTNKSTSVGSGGGLAAKTCSTLETPWTLACQAPLSMGFPRQKW